MKFSESVPLYKQPLSIPAEQLPQPDLNRNLPLSKYFLMMKTPEIGFQKAEVRDVLLRKVVLNEIEKIPAIWNCKNTYNANKLYPEVAVQVYRRTGTLLHTKMVQMVFKTAKDSLRNRLRDAISRKGLNEVDTEAHLLEWEYYPFVRFYREVSEGWEDRMRKTKQLEKREPAGGVGIVGDDENSMDVEEEPYENPDIIWDDVADPESPTTSMSSTLTSTQGTFTDYHPEEPYHNPEPPLIHPTLEYAAMKTASLQRNQQNKHVMEVRHGSETRTVVVMPTEPPRQQLNAPDFAEEMLQVTYQATRIAREQPERVKLLRKALFDTVLAFDQKEYNCVADLYRDLAEKSSR